MTIQQSSTSLFVIVWNCWAQILGILLSDYADFILLYVCCKSISKAASTEREATNECGKFAYKKNSSWILRLHCIAWKETESRLLLCFVHITHTKLVCRAERTPKSLKYRMIQSARFVIFFLLYCSFDELQDSSTFSPEFGSFCDLNQ